MGSCCSKSANSVLTLPGTKQSGKPYVKSVDCNTSSETLRINVTHGKDFKIDLKTGRKIERFWDKTQKVRWIVFKDCLHLDLKGKGGHYIDSIRLDDQTFKDALVPEKNISVEQAHFLDEQTSKQFAKNGIVFVQNQEILTDSGKRNVTGWHFSKDGPVYTTLLAARDASTLATVAFDLQKRMTLPKQVPKQDAPNPVIAVSTGLPTIPKLHSPASAPPVAAAAPLPPPVVRSGAGMPLVGFTQSQKPDDATLADEYEYDLGAELKIYSSGDNKFVTINKIDYRFSPTVSDDAPAVPVTSEQIIQRLDAEGLLFRRRLTEHPDPSFLGESVPPSGVCLLSSVLLVGGYLIFRCLRKRRPQGPHDDFG